MIEEGETGKPSLGMDQEAGNSDRPLVALLNARLNGADLKGADGGPARGRMEKK